MAKYTVRVRGTVTVNIWKDYEVEADTEDEAIDAANESQDLSGFHNDFDSMPHDVKDATSVEWDASEVVGVSTAS